MSDLYVAGGVPIEPMNRERSRWSRPGNSAEQAPEGIAPLLHLSIPDPLPFERSYQCRDVVRPGKSEEVAVFHRVRCRRILFVDARAYAPDVPGRLDGDPDGPDESTGDVPLCLELDRAEAPRPTSCGTESIPPDPRFGQSAAAPRSAWTGTEKGMPKTREPELTGEL